MDIKAIADQVMAHLGDAPEKLQDIIADPKGAIEGIIGHQLDEAQLQEVVEQVKSGIANVPDMLQNVDLGAFGDKIDSATDGTPLEAVGNMLGGLFKK